VERYLRSAFLLSGGKRKKDGVAKAGMGVKAAQLVLRKKLLEAVSFACF
jgi:hypothetical protein